MAKSKKTKSPARSRPKAEAPVLASAGGRPVTSPRASAQTKALAKDDPNLRRVVTAWNDEAVVQLYQVGIAQLGQIDHTNTLAYWEVGKTLNDAAKHVEEASGRAAKGGEVATAMVRSWHAAGLAIDESLARAARRMAAVWPDADRFATLLARRSKQGKTLTWQHLRHLCSTSLSKEHRTMLLQAFFEEGFSVREMERRVQEAAGRRDPELEAAPALSAARLPEAFRSFDALLGRFTDGVRSLFRSEALAEALEPPAGSVPVALPLVALSSAEARLRAAKQELEDALDVVERLKTRQLEASAAETVIEVEEAPAALPGPAAEEEELAEELEFV